MSGFFFHKKNQHQCSFVIDVIDVSLEVEIAFIFHHYNSFISQKQGDCACINQRAFVAGGANTNFIGKHPDFIWKRHPDFGTKENPTYDQY